MKKLSVIIPVYNVEEYLEECLNSVCNQTLTDIEIICVNDGSTDNSGDILQDFAKQDTRIQIINQENAGDEGSAINQGDAGNANNANDIGKDKADSTGKAQNSTDAAVSKEEAIKKALDKVKGATESDVKIRIEQEDGRNVYDGEIIYNQKEYDFEIDAETGEILEWSEENM